MKILLVDPPWQFLKCDGVTRQVFPLGLASLSASLGADHDVQVLLPDVRTYTGADPWGEIRAALHRAEASVVGISATTATYASAARVAELAKEVDPACTVVLGGVHPTLDPVGSLAAAPAADFVLPGEAEATFPRLVAGIERGAPEVPGLVVRTDRGEARQIPGRAEAPDLAALPMPDRGHLFWEHDVHPALYQSLITTRGCPYDCAYCCVPNLSRRSVRNRPLTAVVEEIAHLRAAHGADYLFFQDSVFTLDFARTVALCDAIRAAGLVTPFTCQTRADRVAPDVLEAMAAAGCRRVILGIESGTRVSLERINKRTTLEQVRAAVRDVKVAGLRCCGFFMIGFPWETEDMMRETMAFAESLGLDSVFLFSAVPLPGSRLWEEAGRPVFSTPFDFTTTPRNFTTLPDAAYTDLFQELRATGATG